MRLASLSQLARNPLQFNEVAQREREREIEFFIDNLLVRIRFIILMIKWTGLARNPMQFTQVFFFTPVTDPRRSLNPNL